MVTYVKRNQPNLVLFVKEARISELTSKQQTTRRSNKNKAEKKKSAQKIKRAEIKAFEQSKQHRGPVVHTFILKMQTPEQHHHSTTHYYCCCSLLCIFYYFNKILCTTINHIPLV